jgi:hypothetical protein
VGRNRLGHVAHLLAGCFSVGLGEDSAHGSSDHPFEASFDQAAQEFEPEGLFLAGADIKAQDGAFALLGDCNSNNNSHTNDTMILAHLQVLGHPARDRDTPAQAGARESLAPVRPVPR